MSRDVRPHFFFTFLFLVNKIYIACPSIIAYISKVKINSQLDHHGTHHNVNIIICFDLDL